jgi:polyisoprenoid-binding protein YceI
MKTYYVDKQNSVIHWKVKKNGDALSGQMKFKEGRLVSELDELLEGSVKVDLQSVQIGEEYLGKEDQLKLEKKIRSEAFLDVEHNPSATIRFEFLKDAQENTKTRGIMEFKDYAYNFSIPLTLEQVEKELKMTSEFALEHMNPNLFEEIKHLGEATEHIHSIVISTEIFANRKS